jgi:hypothetical protein
MGWTDVPARRHPELFGPVTGEDTILLFRDMALMERPIEITQDARRFELRKARKDVRDQSEKLRLSTAEHFDRKVQVARTHHAGGLSDRKTEYNGEIPGDDE